MADVAGADVRLQMDLGTAPFILNRDHLTTDILTPPDDAYDDVTCDVARGSWAWGATQPLGALTTVSGGRGHFDLLDPTRLFDPSNGSSPYATVLHIGTPLRVLVDGDAVWSGALNSWSYDVGGLTASLDASDALAALAALPVPTGTVIASGSFLAQAGKVLDAAGWSPSRRSFTGTPASYRSAVTVDGSAAAVLESVRLAELGEVWADHAGNIAARGRGDPYAPPPAATINCGGALLASMQSVFAADRVRNYIEVDGHAPPDLQRHGVNRAARAAGVPHLDRGPRLNRRPRGPDRRRSGGDPGPGPAYRPVLDYRDHLIRPRANRIVEPGRRGRPTFTRWLLGGR